jgi:hypothetical protein
MILRKLIASIVFYCLALITFSQAYSCKIEYKHMRGQLNESEAILDLQIFNNEINGTCVFPDRIFEEGPLAGYTRTERLKGVIDIHGVATIKAFTQNIEAGEYSGVLKDVFKGTFREASHEKSVSFSFEEDYSDNVIPFVGYCINKDSSLLDTLNSPEAHLELSMLLPHNEPGMEILRKAIIKTFLGIDMENNIPDDSLLHYFGMDYFGRYVDANRDLYDGGMSFNWEIINNSSIGLNHYGLLVYRSDNYGYTGGAHGMGISRFLVFDTYNMIELELDDILIPGYADELSKMLERNYRLSNYVGPEQSLVEAGLFKNHIPPSKNFFITENSIGFYYNPYNLAPYAMGAQLISLTWQEILPLIREASPVRRIWE